MSVTVELYTSCYSNYVNGKMSIFTTENLNFSGQLHQSSVNAQNSGFLVCFFFTMPQPFFSASIFKHEWLFLQCSYGVSTSATKPDSTSWSLWAFYIVVLISNQFIQRWNKASTSHGLDIQKGRLVQLQMELCQLTPSKDIALRT